MNALLFSLVAALAVAGMPEGASAQEPTLNQPGLRLKAQLGAGIQFFPGAASAIVGTGVNYGVFVSWQPWWYGGVELSYGGANYNTIDPDGNEVSLFENGAELALKASPNFGVVEPYALAGIGFAVLTETSEQGRRPVLDENTMVKVPLGLGVDFHLASRRRSPVPHVTLGVRGVYRLVFHHPILGVSERGADQISLLGLVGMQL